MVSARLRPVNPMASECMDRSGPSHNFTTVRDAARDQVFLLSFHRNPISVDDQRIAAVHNYHVFIANRGRVANLQT
jgi:hypothetical protein